MTAVINTALVRQAARGNWDMILRTLASQALGPALDAMATRGKDTHVACPIHGGKDGFRFFADYEETGAAVCNTCGTFKDGFALLMAVTQMGFSDVKKAVAGVLGITPETKVVPLKVKNASSVAKRTLTTEELNATAERTAARKLWEEAIPFEAMNAERVKPLKAYLAGRSIPFTNVKSLRFCETVKTVDNGKSVLLPAMLAAVRDVEGEIVTLHRTFITKDGRKAAVTTPKKVMKVNAADSISGAAIHFGEPHTVLGIAEGIETALSVVKATRLPVWSAVSASGLKAVRIPTTVRKVLIFEDKDASGTGQKAALHLKERLLKERPELKVRIVSPSLEIPEGSHGVDFNDVLTFQGIDAIKASVMTL